MTSSQGSLLSKPYSKFQTPPSGALIFPFSRFHQSSCHPSCYITSFISLFVYGLSACPLELHLNEGKVFCLVCCYILGGQEIWGSISGSVCSNTGKAAPLPVMPNVLESRTFLKPLTSCGIFKQPLLSGSLFPWLSSRCVWPQLRNRDLPKNLLYLYFLSSPVLSNILSFQNCFFWILYCSN